MLCSKQTNKQLDQQGTWKTFENCTKRPHQWFWDYALEH